MYVKGRIRYAPTILFSNKLNDWKTIPISSRILSMLFFLVFVVGSYTMVSRRNQQQAESNAELKNAYVRDGVEQYDAFFSTSTDGYIPVKTKKDYSDNLNDFKEDIAILKKYLK